MAPFVSPALAVVSAIVAVVSLLLYFHSIRRSDRDSARDEALALAETRGELVAELRAALHETRAETRETLIILRGHLEQSPPDVAGALKRIRRILERELSSPHAPSDHEGQNRSLRDPIVGRTRKPRGTDYG